jgi:hypothetical protein
MRIRPTGAVLPWLALLLLGLLASPNDARATPDGVWSGLQYPWRFQHMAAFDDAGRRMIVYGGDSGVVPPNDVWIRTFGPGGRWTRFDAGGPAPSNRTGCALIYDSARNRILLFGGTIWNGTITSELWELGLTPGSSWKLVPINGAPPPARTAMAAIYDAPRDRFLVVGGKGVNPDLTSNYLNDVWSYDPNSNVWYQLGTTGTPPSPRASAGLAYDSSRDQLILFGGTFTAFGNVFEYNDTWTLSLAGTPAWQSLSLGGTPPSIRHGAGVFYDTVADRVVVFGGATGTTIQTDANVLVLGASPQWTGPAIPADPTGEGSPGKRRDATMVWDSAARRALMFGGRDPVYSDPLDDILALDVAGTLAWSRPEDLNAPHYVTGPAVFDSVGNRMVILGSSTSWPGGAKLDELFAFDLTTPGRWTRVPITGLPPNYGPGIYDPVRRRFLVFPWYETNRVWALSLDGTPAWTAFTPAGGPPNPGPRQEHSAVYDAVGDRMVIFGGIPNTNWVCGNIDAWELSLSGVPAWTLLLPTGSLPKYFFTGQSFTYDPIRNSAILEAAYTSTGTCTQPGLLLPETYELSLGAAPSWSAWPPEPMNGYRTGQSSIYDPARERMVIFSGQGLSGTTPPLWSLDASNPQWTQLQPSGVPPDRSLRGHTAVYDPVADRMIVVGGTTYNTGDKLISDDFWLLTWGDIPTAQVTCPGDLVWTTGALNPVDYTIQNLGSIAAQFHARLTSARDWAGLPIDTTFTLDGGATGTLTLQVPVPDSAALGANILMLEVDRSDAPGAIVSCSHHIHDSSTPTLPSFVSFEANAGRVVVTWSAPGLPGVEVGIDRARGEEGWMRLAQVDADASGRITYTDQAVTPGETNRYRLAIPSGASESYFGEVSVRVPGVALAVWPEGANPSTRGPRLAISLPDGAPASLQVLDVRGRLVLRKGVGSAGPGVRHLDLAADRAFAPGLYFIVLRQGSQSARTHVLVLR